MDIKTISLANKQYFTLKIGKRVLIKDLHNKKPHKTFGNMGLDQNDKHDIPLYSSNPSEIYGYVEKSNISETFSHSHVLWGIDGKFTFNVMKKGQKFATTDHCGTIEILNDNIMSEYLALQLDLKKQQLTFDRTLRPSLETMKKHVEIDIPINKSGEPDYNAQSKIFDQYNPILDFQQKIQKIQSELIDQKIIFDSSYEYKEKPLSKLFILSQGDSYYTKKRILENKWEGDIPIYSSNTENDGLLIKIDLKQIKKEHRYFQNCLTWTIDGLKAGTIFVRNSGNLKNEEKKEFYFTINNHCGILISQKENVYLPFIKHVLQPIFYELAKGYGKKKLGTNQIEKLSIRIPINDKGDCDLQKQVEIANMYDSIEKSKNEIIEELDLLINQKVALA